MTEPIHEKPSPDELDGLESETGDPEKPYMASMGIYVFNRGLLVRMLTGDGGHDFGKHIIPKAINNLKVKGYLYDGYWEDIGTIKSFFNASLALTDEVPVFDLYQRDKPIYTRPRYLPASKINGCMVKRSMICEGCFIGNGEIDRTIVGIRSRIGENVRISDTIVMGADYYQTLKEIRQSEQAGSPLVGIGRNVEIRNAIIDKNACIGDNVRLVNESGVEEGTYDGFEVREGIIVVYKNAIVSGGTVF